MARIFDNFAMFGYMKKNWKESKKKMGSGKKEKGKGFYVSFNVFGRWLKRKGKKEILLFLNYFCIKK